MISLTPKKTSEMSLDDIEAAIQRNEAEERAERAEKARDRNELEQARRDRFELVGTHRRELAADLGCDPSGLAAVIQVRAPQTGETAMIWRMLLTVSHAADDVDLVAVREARHVLGAMGQLPAVRRDDRAFGSAKALRGLPRVVRSGDVVDLSLESIARAVGLAMPEREQPAESYDVTRERIASQRARGMFDRKNMERNDALATRALELATAERFAFVRRAQAAHMKAVGDFREAMVAVVDRTLGTLELGPAWAWARELRRHLAGERVRISDVMTVWHTAASLGARFDFSKVGA